MPRTIAYRAGGFTNCGIGYTKFSQEELAEMKDRAMTENEVIKILRKDSCYECAQGTDSPVNCEYEECIVAEATREAIKALKEVQQYRESARQKSAVKLWRSRRRFQERLSRENTSAQSVIT